MSGVGLCDYTETQNTQPVRIPSHTFTSVCVWIYYCISFTWSSRVSPSRCSLTWWLQPSPCQSFPVWRSEKRLCWLCGERRAHTWLVEIMAKLHSRCALYCACGPFPPLSNILHLRHFMNKWNILKMMVSRSPIMIFDCFLYFFSLYRCWWKMGPKRAIRYLWRPETLY